MEIRPLKEEEQKYTYTQSGQLVGQTGCVGHLRGDFDRDGNGFFTSWYDHGTRWKTDVFKKELDDVVNTLRFGGPGLLENRAAMRRYAGRYPESAFDGNGHTIYGFRVETEQHAFLLRCDPSPGDYNFYCYCYVKELLDRNIEKAAQGIRFIDSRYHELFRIKDGEKITVTFEDGVKKEYECRYIDEYHTEVGDRLYHICQFAEVMERNGSAYAPAEPKLEREEEKGEEKTEPEEPETEETAEELAETPRMAPYFYEPEPVTVTLEAGAYTSDRSLHVWLMEEGDTGPEPYADVTVNLDVSVPSYCAYVDTNNMPELEGFLVDNNLAEFTGLVHNSGFCSYPLYMFNAEGLRELCPDGMATYEQENGLDKKTERKEKSR